MANKIMFLKVLGAKSLKTIANTKQCGSTFRKMTLPCIWHCDIKFYNITINHLIFWHLAGISCWMQSPSGELYFSFPSVTAAEGIASVSHVTLAQVHIYIYPHLTHFLTHSASGNYETAAHISIFLHEGGQWRQHVSLSIFWGVTLGSEP